jgi:hypothetical protein
MKKLLLLASLVVLGSLAGCGHPTDITEDIAAVMAATAQA